MEITVKVGRDGPDHTFNVAAIPDTDNELLDMYGEAEVCRFAKAQMVVSAQGIARDRLKKEQAPKDVQAALDGWKPGVRKRGRSKAERFTEDFRNMDPEVRAALLKELATLQKAG